MTLNNYRFIFLFFIVSMANNAFALDLSSTIASSSNRIQTGISVTYTGTVINNSSTLATNSQLIFYMPPRNVNYISLPVGCTIKVKITCLLGDIAGGASVNKSITVSYSSAGSAIVSALAFTDSADGNTSNNLSRLTTNVTKSISNSVTIPSISSVTPNPVSVTLGNSINFSATLSGNLPSGYNVKLNYSNSSISMSGSGTSYNVSQAPTQLGQQVFSVGIYDANNTLKSNTLTSNFEIVKANTAPTLSFVGGNTTATAGTSYSIQLQASDADSNLKSISVTWGDGATDTQTATNGRTLMFTHTYAASNTYTWSATAYDSSNANSSAITKSVTVSAASVTPPVSTTGYTKISNSGAALPDTGVLGSGSNEWACTKDNKTGLTWEVKTDDGRLRDKDWWYSWYEPDASVNGGLAGYQNANGHPEYCSGSDCDTYAYKNAVNKKTLCGAANWRLPTKNELMKLVVCSDSQYRVDGSCTNGDTVTNPTINSTYFPNTISSWYWSSSTINEVVVVYFYRGRSGSYNKDSYHFVRLVLDTLPPTTSTSNSGTTLPDTAVLGSGSSGYTKISNSGAALPDTGVLGSGSNEWACTKDNKTGLTWEVKTTDGGLRDWDKTYTNYFVGETGGYGGSTNSDYFVSSVNKKTLCGTANWRLPTKDELQKLVYCLDGKYNADGSCTNGDTFTNSTINSTYFPNTHTIDYWSSSPYTNYSSYAWSVNFGYGVSNTNRKNGSGFVRLVRG